MLDLTRADHRSVVGRCARCTLSSGRCSRCLWPFLASKLRLLRCYRVDVVWTNIELVTYPEKISSITMGLRCEKTRRATTSCLSHCRAAERDWRPVKRAMAQNSSATISAKSDHSNAHRYALATDQVRRFASASSVALTSNPTTTLATDASGPKTPPLQRGSTPAAGRT